MKIFISLCVQNELNAEPFRMRNKTMKINSKELNCECQTSSHPAKRVNDVQSFLVFLFLSLLLLLFFSLSLDIIFSEWFASYWMFRSLQLKSLCALRIGKTPPGSGLIALSTINRTLSVGLFASTQPLCHSATRWLTGNLTK